MGVSSLRSSLKLCGYAAGRLRSARISPSIAEYLSLRGAYSSTISLGGSSNVVTLLTILYGEVEGVFLRARLQTATKPRPPANAPMIARAMKGAMYPG